MIGDIDGDIDERSVEAPIQGRRAKQEQTNPWLTEAHDFLRGLAGAFLLGIPLLYTMEMWWIGQQADLWKLLLFLLVAFGVNLSLIHFSEFKAKTIVGGDVEQAIEAVAVGIVASTVVLVVLNRFTVGDPLDAILGMIVVQTVPLSIGASAANAIFASRGKSRLGDEEQPAPPQPWRETLNDLGATIAGGIFIGFSIAPSEEIPMLAAELSHAHQLALVALSLLVTYFIVFVSGFDPQHAGDPPPGVFQHPVSETSMAYVVSLLVALAALYFFNQIDVGQPLSTVVSQTIVLGLPTAIGGAAGRLVI